MSKNKTYVKNDPMYDDPSDFEEEKIKEARKRRKRGGRKVPTSVALDPELIEAIKAIAEDKGVPYQVLLRMFIIDGYKKMDEAG